ncbi:MAG: hypothetical protein AB1603_02145 [Chloroflexota bacterium]
MTGVVANIDMDVPAQRAETTGGRAQLLVKLALGVGFLLVAAAFLLARTHPATGWELDIYASTPLLFWAFAVAAIAIGLAVIIYEVSLEKPGRIWLLAFLLLLLSNTAITLLPHLRGYLYMNPADSTGHLAFIRDIFDYGRFSTANTYPLNHIFIWAVAGFGGMNLEATARVMPSLFTLLFMIGTYLLATVCFARRQVAMLAAAASVTLLFYYYNVMVYPNGFGLLFFPLLMYSYFLSRERHHAGYRAIFVLLLMASIFFHPKTAVLTIAYMVLAEVAMSVASWWCARSSPSQSYRYSFSAAWLVGIGFFLWISSSYLFEGQVRGFWEFFQGQLLRNQHIVAFGGTIESQGLPFRSELMTGLKAFGDNIAYTLMAAAGTVVVLFYLWRRRAEAVRPFVLLVLFVVSGPLEVVMFLGSGTTTVGRFLGSNPLWWATTALTAFLLFLWLEKRKGVLLGRLPAWGAVFIPAVVSVLWLYPSPRLLNVNWQVTYAEQSVLRWEMERGVPRYEVMLLGLVNGTRGLVQAYDRQIAAEDRPAWYYLQALGTESKLEASQLNYSRYSSIGDWDYNRGYMIVTDRFRLGSSSEELKAEGFVVSFFYAAPGFSEQTFERYNDDPALQHLYSNGGADIFLIRRDYRNWVQENYPNAARPSF